jgi:hypothetical protein
MSDGEDGAAVAARVDRILRLAREALLTRDATSLEAVLEGYKMPQLQAAGRLLRQRGVFAAGVPVLGGQLQVVRAGFLNAVRAAVAPGGAAFLMPGEGGDGADIDDTHSEVLDTIGTDGLLDAGDAEQQQLAGDDTAQVGHAVPITAAEVHQLLVQERQHGTAEIQKCMKDLSEMFTTAISALVDPLGTRLSNNEEACRQLRAEVRALAAARSEQQRECPRGTLPPSPPRSPASSLAGHASLDIIDTSHTSSRRALEHGECVEIIEGKGHLLPEEVPDDAWELDPAGCIRAFENAHQTLDRWDTATCDKYRLQRAGGGELTCRWHRLFFSVLTAAVQKKASDQRARAILERINSLRVTADRQYAAGTPSSAMYWDIASTICKMVLQRELTELFTEVLTFQVEAGTLFGDAVTALRGKTTCALLVLRLRPKQLSKAALTCSIISWAQQQFGLVAMHMDLQHYADCADEVDPDELLDKMLALADTVIVPATAPLLHTGTVIRVTPARAPPKSLVVLDTQGTRVRGGAAAGAKAELNELEAGTQGRASYPTPHHQFIEAVQALELMELEVRKMVCLNCNGTASTDPHPWRRCPLEQFNAENFAAYRAAHPYTKITVPTSEADYLHKRAEEKSRQRAAGKGGARPNRFKHRRST